MSIVRSFAKNILIDFKKVYQRIVWKHQYNKVKTKLVTFVDSKSISSLRIKKALILCPHADDEWIGCSSILSDLSIESTVLYYRMYGYDQSKVNKKTRDRELRKCAEKWKFGLTGDGTTALRYLEESIALHKYDTIFVPSPIDWHWEHRDVFRGLIDVLKTVHFTDVNILYYYVSVPCIYTTNVFTSVLTHKQQNAKWFFFEQNYLSQIMPIKRYKLQERINGTFASSYAAEVFYLASQERLFQDYNMLHEGNSIQTLNSLKTLINDIYCIRQAANSIIKQK